MWMNCGFPTLLTPSMRLSISHYCTVNVVAGAVPSSVVLGPCHHLVSVKSCARAGLSALGTCLSLGGFLCMYVEDIPIEDETASNELF